MTNIDPEIAAWALARIRARPLVGGFLQLTTIAEHEISTRIIHRWSDRVGEPI